MRIRDKNKDRNKEKKGFSLPGKKSQSKRSRKKAGSIRRPEVCLSLSCATLDELKKEIEEYKDCCQIVEWCVDGTCGSSDYTKEEFTSILRDLKKQCRGKKLTVDYKGDEDTGNRIQRWAMGIADIIDIDVNNSQVREMVKEARRKRTKALISCHYFEEMPARDDIATQYIKMEKTGGDILKIACFAEKEPQSYEVLEAAYAYTQLRKHRPIVAIAMGEEGQASRICAGDFGSVITYACGSTPTAPGQFNARDLSRYLDIYYERK